jgi:Alpha-galactosidase
MKTDPRFELKVEDFRGQAALRFTAARELAIDSGATTLFEASLEELCDIARVPGPAREELVGTRARPRSRRSEPAILSNGWQSWCYGGELWPGERIARARIAPHINAYTDGPGPREGRLEILSRFVTYLRAGEHRLVLASRGSPEGPTPPVAFRWSRRERGLRAEVAAYGARFAKGALVAEIRLFYREGYIAAKDALRDVFRDYGHFQRLAFLGTGGSLVPGGYESWYNHYTAIDESIIGRDLESIGSNDNLIAAYYIRRGKPTVFQIDDGWEIAVGEWKPDPVKFPGGMKVFADAIEAKGMIPGLWIAPLLVTKSCALYKEKPEWLLRDARGRPVPAGLNPGWDGTFYCLDPSLPEVEDYLAGVFSTIIEDWGYRYVKLDFLYAAFLAGGRFRGLPGAAYEHYDRLMRRLTSISSNAHGPVAYLGCGAPLEGSFRHFPLMRIGADTKEQWEDALLGLVVRHQGRPAAYTNMTHTIGRSILDGTVFVNDPDVVFCRTSRMRLTEAEKELIALLDFMLASQVMFSDDAHEFGEKEEAAFTSRLVDLYDRLAGGSYGAQRIGRDVYSIFSRDGRVKGIANLSGRPWRQTGFDPGSAFLLHASRVEGELAFDPHSLSLFEA